MFFSDKDLKEVQKIYKNTMKIVPIAILEGILVKSMQIFLKQQME